MHANNLPKHVRKRIVLHFPGFEPLDAHQHHARYKRSAEKTAKLWDIRIDVDQMRSDGRGWHFDVDSEGTDWQASSRIYMLDHGTLVERLNNRPLFNRLARGFLSAARVVIEGGAAGYFAHAWRFGLFFVFPFLLVALALAASLAIAAYPYWLGLDPWHYALSFTFAYVLFFRIFLPWSDRLHILHLFADWELAVAAARLDQPYLEQWLEECVALARPAFNDVADEYVVSSHSMGSSIAAHVIGALLEREPHLLDGKRVVFATLGGAILQCALLRCAKVLRARVGLIARAEAIFWFEVHCLTDAIHFYKSRVVALAGHHDAPHPRIAFIRVKHMLSPERYRRIKRDFLRVHRQYVLDADMRAPFDFTLMTAGPLPAASFVDFSHGNLPAV